MKTQLHLVKTSLLIVICLLTICSVGTNAQQRMFTGSYDGTGIDNETISGIGFQPAVVIVKRELGSNEAQIRMASMPDGLSKQMYGSAAMYTNRIKSFTSDGFVVGTNTDVNTLGERYYFIAFEDGPNLSVGSYTGNGTDARPITGIGFQPDLVILMPNDANRSSWRSATFPDADASAFGSDFNLSNTIEALNADGFTVGKDARGNKSGASFYYAAFKSSASCMKVGTYSGTGVAKTISGVGFRPEFMFIKSGGDNAACMKTRVMPDISSIEFNTSRIDDGRLSGLNDDGFAVGTQGQVNQNNRTYHYVAFRDCDPVVPVKCIATGSYTGNGADNREITGLGFSPAVVMVKVVNGSNEAQIRTSTMANGYSRQMVGASPQYTNRIKSFTSDGFVVGTNNDVNASGKTYIWTAYDVSGVLEVGTYIGDGTDNRPIAGVGFNPDMVWILPRTDNRASWRSRTFPSANCSAFGSDFGIAKTLTALNSNGFTIGNSARANKPLEVYHYVAFKEDPSLLSLGSYTGNGVAGNNISIPGFDIQYMFIKSAGTNAAVQKSDMLPLCTGSVASGSIEFAGSGLDCNRILSMGSGGFAVGSPQMVNRVNTVYHYAAFRACTSLPARPGLPSVAAREEKFSIFPNPAGDFFTLKISSAKAEKAQYVLRDFAGRAVSTSAVSLVPGINQYRVNVADLPAGTYLLRYTDESGKSKTQKVVVSR